MHYRATYSSIVGHAEIYYMFIELGLSKISKKGYPLSYITPNAWMTNKYARGVRNLILKKHRISEIINFNQQVIFDDARVETAIISASSFSSNDSLFVGHNINSKYPFDIKEWLKDSNLIINFSEDEITQNILYKINSTSTSLSDFLDISNGCKPYQAGYGKNLLNEKLTKEDVKQRIYHAKHKVSEEFYLELKGKHVQPYFIKLSTDYINWGSWLMSPKESKYFFQKKILIRQIIGKKFICAIDESNSIADQSIYVGIKIKHVKISLETILGILNSTLYGFFFRKFYSEEDDLFPKIKVNELKRLPFKSIDRIIAERIEDKVNKILVLKKENPETVVSGLELEIDALVYQLYNLNQEEIEVITNSN